MKVVELPQWTLSARLEGAALQFILGDGRRVAWHSRRPAQLIALAVQPSMASSSLLGDELARRLAESAPRVLNIQLEERLDFIAWEQLSLGSSLLAQQFVVARQPVGENEVAWLGEPALADALAVVVLMPPGCLTSLADAFCVCIDDLDDPQVCDVLSNAHVVVLKSLQLARLMGREAVAPAARLLVTDDAQPFSSLAAALDTSASVLVLGQDWGANEALVKMLCVQLDSGASVGEAVRLLHRSARPGCTGARLYGDPGKRFVRPRVVTSRRQITSLSFDVVGSTALLRRLGDEVYAELLSTLHRRCTDIVREHGGRPDDPQGDDGVMCYFGYPVAVEEAPVHAVKAGLEIASAGDNLGISVRAGIATGLVAINAEQPIGLAVHLAARLQQIAAPGAVLISESTRRLVDYAFDLQALPEHFQLKGIDEPQVLYIVGAMHRPAASHRLERQAWLTPLVGRQEELACLNDCWRNTQAGQCLLTVVRGEAGMGKSRLVREFRHQLMQSGFKVLECRCRPDASASPFLALAEALRRWLDIRVDSSNAQSMRKLAAALPDGEGQGESLSLMAALLGLSAQPSHSSPITLRQRLLKLLLQWFRSVARDRPSCLIVEDWHWVDPSMREFVEDLASRREGAGLLVVLTIRNEAARACTTPPVQQVIDLTGLSRETSREMVRLVCADAPLPAGLIHALADRGDGVPLFLEEAARMALELSTSESSLKTSALEAVPDSLHDLLMVRLDSLGLAKQIAQVAAVVGRDFSHPMLSALMDTTHFAVEAAELSERLAILVDSGLIRALGGDLYTFKHALVRDAAYASLWIKDRRMLHARMVRLLQHRWPELAEAQPELLALHLTEAGMFDQALVQWELAARSATNRSAELEAISHLRHALSVLGHLEPAPDRDRTALRLQLVLAARLIATEGYGADAVLLAYREAQRLCDQIGDETARFKVEMGLEAYRFMRADFLPALEHGRRAAAIAARSGDTKQRIHAHWGLACTLFHQGELRATMREMESGLALYTPALHPLFGVQDPGIMCLAYSSWGLWEIGRPDSALARINHAVSMAEEFRHKFSQAVALAYGVSILLLRGDTEAALARALKCIHVCDDAGFPVWLAITRCMRGRLLCEKGNFEVGLSEMRAGYALWLSTGSLVSRPLYLALQIEGLMLAGELEAAQACVDEGLGVADRYGERQLEAELRRLQGELALRRADRAQAEASLRSAYVLALRQRRLGFALRSATSLAKLWVDDGRRNEARQLITPLVARWKEGRGTRDVRDALVLSESLAEH